MKLLITTQAVDTEDPTLGFFVQWIQELAPHFESIEVVCLKEGLHTLPTNVTVHSLGKEKGKRSRMAYAATYLALVWKLRNRYDASFAHMNQEYILIAGWLWKFMGKPIYMWRNHYAGSILTDTAAVLCAKVFCTSTHSHTAKYRKTVLMPVGVDTSRFYPEDRIERTPRSLLFLARISPSKRPDVFIEALGLLIAKGISFIGSVYGTPQPPDQAYYESLKGRAEALGLHDRIRFHGGVPNEKAADIYRAHELFVNCSPSGMFDKTIFEAGASGCIVLASSKDYADLTESRYHFTDAESLADRLEYWLTSSQSERAATQEASVALAQLQGLPDLGKRLAHEILLA